jgi:hypothetical protein
MSAAETLAAHDASAPIVDRESVAFVLWGWSGCSLAQVESLLPPHLDRNVVRALAVQWLESLAIPVTAERIEALVMVGARRESHGRMRVRRSA